MLYGREMAIKWTIGADANDPQALAAFWAQALGYVPERGYDGPEVASIIDPDGLGPAIGFLRVPEPKSGKNRFHVDIRVAGEPPWDLRERARMIRATADHLLTLGATEVREDRDDDVLDHVVMLDPEGNEFCVA